MNILLQLCAWQTIINTTVNHRSTINKKQFKISKWEAIELEMLEGIAQGKNNVLVYGIQY